MTYTSSLQSTASPCFHHAPACRMAMSTARSSLRVLNLRTLYDASCKPNDSDTSSRKRLRSLRLNDRQCACTSAKSRINSGLGSGNSGVLWGGSMGRHGRATSLNGTLRNAVNAKVIPGHLNYSQAYVGDHT